jgi:PII-like signaling protein
MEEYAQRRSRASVRLVGKEGFGKARRIRTDRFEAAWDDLPMVVMAVDACAAIHAASPEVCRLVPDGLVILGRTRILDPSVGGVVATPGRLRRARDPLPPR